MTRTFSPDLPNVLQPGPVLDLLHDCDAEIEALAKCSTLPALAVLLRLVRAADLASRSDVGPETVEAAAVALASIPFAGDRLAREIEESNAYVLAMRKKESACAHE